MVGSHARIHSRQFSSSSALYRSFNLTKKNKAPRQKLDPCPNWSIPAPFERKSDKDIPFLFLPHTVKKAYRVNNSFLTLPGCFEKQLWLTKSIPSAGLPENYLPATGQHLQAAHQLMLDTLAQSCAYQKRPLQNNYSDVDARMRYSMFENFFRVAFMYGGDCEHLQFENCSLFHRPRLETHWPRNYLFYNANVRVDLLLKTRNPLPCIEDTPDVTPDQLQQLPGPFTPHAMNLFRHGLKPHLRNRVAMENSHHSDVKQNHTSIFIHHAVKTDESILAGGVINAFMLALSQAQDRGQLFGTELSSPIVTQCVVTNGNKCAFFVFQLNTMQFNDDKGVWNRVWMSPPMEMFTLKDEEGKRFLYEDAAVRDPVEGLSEEFTRHFLGFVRKAT